jgi:glycosyltransferase involved in cell wall biosynthesis
MVSIIACTMRDQMLQNVFNNYSRQKWEEKELIIILNRDTMRIEDWQKYAENYHNVSVYQLPERETLGDCMNFGIEKARYDIVAKFDDDDYYSPFYLTEAMEAFRKTDAELVGKGTSFLYFEESELLTLYKKADEESTNMGFLKGGTFVFKKSIYPEIKFPSQKTRCTHLFREICMHRNIRMYSTSRFNYVWIRRPDFTTHTYQLPPEEFMKVCEVIDHTTHYESLITKIF